MPPTADNVSVSVPNVAQSVKMDSMVRAKLLWLCGMERKCDAIEQGYCVSSLLQYQFEVEDFYLENGERVRYGFDKHKFYDYSFRGYAELSDIQVSQTQH